MGGRSSGVRATARVGVSLPLPFGYGDVSPALAAMRAAATWLSGATLKRE
jgi:hypothetical protein